MCDDHVVGLEKRLSVNSTSLTRADRLKTEPFAAQRSELYVHDTQETATAQVDNRRFACD